MKYEVISSMGEYMLVDSNGRQHGYTVTEENDGMKSIEALYAMCRAMNVSEEDLEGVEWVDNVIESMK